MHVDVSGSIVYNPDADEEYKIICKSLDIEEDGSGTIEESIETLRQSITDAIVKEFKVSPEEVRLTGYRMTMNFEISGPVNHTLDQFEGKKGKGKGKETDKDQD